MATYGAKVLLNTTSNNASMANVIFGALCAIFAIGAFFVLIVTFIEFTYIAFKNLKTKSKVINEQEDNLENKEEKIGSSKTMDITFGTLHIIYIKLLIIGVLLVFAI